MTRKKTRNIMQDSIQDYINYCHTVEKALELACHYIVKTEGSPCACPIYRSGTKCELLDKGMVATCTQCWQEEFLKRALKEVGDEELDSSKVLKEKDLMLCTGDYCNKKDKCARYFKNADMSEPCQVESFASFGSGHAYVDENGSHIIEDEIWCGPNGHYKMYKEN